MPALTSIALGLGIAGAAASTAGTIYQIDQSNRRSDEAKAFQATQNAKQDDLLNQEKSRVANEESDANATLVRDQAKDRAKKLAAGAGGKSSTILTSPLGLTGNAGAPSGAKKTLLGM